MTARNATASGSIGTPRSIFGLILVTIFGLPQFPFFDPPHLFTPANKMFLNWYIGASATLGYVAFFGLFMWGNWKVAYAELGIIIGIFGFIIAALCGTMAFFSGERFYSYYELVHLPHEQRSLLYAVESISIRGRGGYHAWVRPYGLRSWGLPLSTADYHAYHSGTLTPPGLCYRVIELRRGGIIESSGSSSHQNGTRPTHWSAVATPIRDGSMRPRRAASSPICKDHHSGLCGLLTRSE